MNYRGPEAATARPLCWRRHLRAGPAQRSLQSVDDIPMVSIINKNAAIACVILV